MERYILDDFEVRVTFEKVKEKLRLKSESDISEVLPKFEEAKQIARPKAVYRVCYVDAIDGDEVTIDGIHFKSELLAKNLDGIHRVFAYVATCGTEVDDWSHGETDMFMSLWLDMIKEMFLMDARDQFFSRIKEKYQIEKTSTMNPGSGNADVWPIQQQVELFQLIGNVHEDIGALLNPNMLMIPTKTVSGLLFPSDGNYINCAYCLREECSGRQVPYDPVLLK
jgi:hypothetical protein